MIKNIRLQGLRLNVSIGIHDFEQVAPQPYQLDISLGLDTRYRTRNDRIEETVDYDALRQRVIAHLGSQHFNLQETVVQDVIDLCFALDERVQQVEIHTGKTSVYPDCESVGLHYACTRAEWLADRR